MTGHLFLYSYILNLGGYLIFMIFPQYVSCHLYGIVNFIIIGGKETERNIYLLFFILWDLTVYQNFFVFGSIFLHVTKISTD